MASPLPKARFKPTFLAAASPMPCFFQKQHRSCDIAWESCEDDERLPGTAQFLHSRTRGTPPILQSRTGLCRSDPVCSAIRALSRDWRLNHDCRLGNQVRLPWTRENVLSEKWAPCDPLWAPCDLLWAP